MAYIPESNSVVSYQAPGSILSASVFGSVGASVIGTVPVTQATNPWTVDGEVTVGNFSGSVVAFQGTNPWIVDGEITFGNFPTNQNVAGSVVAFQGTSPWTVDGTVSVGNFPAIQDIAGSVVAFQGTNPWTVDGEVTVGNFPTNQNISGSVVSFQGTNPWTVDGTVNVGNFPALQDISGSVVSFQGTDPWVISGEVTQGTTPWVITGSVQGDLNATVSSASVVQEGTWRVSVISSTPSSMLAGASIFGQLPAGTAVLGSVATLQGTTPWIISSIYGNISGSVASFPRGTIITSLVSTIPSSVIVGASIFGHAPVFIIGGSVATATTNSSVMLLGGDNIIGSVATLQGTNPWIVDGEVTVGNFPTNQNISGSVVAFQGGTVITSIIGAMADTASVYAVLSSITTVSVLSANTNRKGATIYNKASTIVYLKLGTAATTSVFTVSMNHDDYYELPYGWTGVVAGITASNAGIINVTELS